MEANKNFAKKTIIGVMVLIFLTIISMSIGRYPINAKDIFLYLIGRKNLPPEVVTILFKVRLSRILSALLIGSSLALSGAAYQGMFKNPLVSPDILGASTGASFGACLGMLFSWNIFFIQISSFIFGLIAVFITYVLSERVKDGDNILILVLSGVMINTLFSSFVSLIKFIADPYNKLPSITFWLMGSLASVDYKDVLFLIIPILIGIITICLLKWKLNILSLGDEEAKTLGINTKKIRLIAIMASTLMTSATVAIGGNIGWIGLIIPHLARAIVGPDYRYLTSMSIIMGGIFLIFIDDLARIVGGLEIPIGILNSIVGVPFYIYILINYRRDWS
ncbi:FecCD family ABC transporter permease [Anaerosalibacter massiliensis]|uniref:Iron ABC transporter permease n=1 Tax=Anaerosalibacter massiliensis TaxID=1347392 RepID=A0A9X2S6E8_9FIRM|nr:iron ABC transporter permease [Anaerosalibacter massiliensis]MCR2042976.1 iron ABC transporter permease [Anaerosalibacter massiliensis]